MNGKISEFYVRTVGSFLQYHEIFIINNNSTKELFKNHKRYIILSKLTTSKTRAQTLDPDLEIRS